MKRILTVAIVLLGLLAFSLPAYALTYNYSFEFSGATAPEGSAPWLRATFTDITGGVQLKLEAINLTDKEFASNWYFNIKPAKEGVSLSFANISGVVPTTSTFNPDQFNADGDMYYDLEIYFGNDFGAGAVSIFNILGNIVAEDFNAFSEPGKPGVGGPYRTAAHVQGIGDNDDKSGWVTEGSGGYPLPEPGTMILLGLGLLGLGIVVRKRI